MRNNVGTADRILRVTFGITFLSVGILKFFGSFWSYLFSFIGLELLIVAVIGYSPLYQLLDTSSVKPKLIVDQEVANWTTGVPDSEK